MHQRSVRLWRRLKIIFSLFIPHYSEEFPPTCFGGKFQLWGAAGKQRCWMEATAICWSCWWGVRRRIRYFKRRREQRNIKQLCTLFFPCPQKMLSFRFYFLFAFKCTTVWFLFFYAHGFAGCAVFPLCVNEGQTTVLTPTSLISATEKFQVSANAHLQFFERIKLKQPCYDTTGETQTFAALKKLFPLSFMGVTPSTRIKKRKKKKKTDRSNGKFRSVFQTLEGTAVADDPEGDSISAWSLPMHNCMLIVLNAVSRTPRLFYRWNKVFDLFREDRWELPLKTQVWQTKSTRCDSCTHVWHFVSTQYWDDQTGLCKPEYNGS